jgi:hypothetical protein
LIQESGRATALENYAVSLAFNSLKTVCLTDQKKLIKGLKQNLNTGIFIMYLELSQAATEFEAERVQTP